MVERESLQRSEFSIRHAATGVWETDARAAGEDCPADRAAVPGNAGCAVESLVRGIMVGGVVGDGGEDFVGGEVGGLRGAEVLWVVVRVLGHVGEGFSGTVREVRFNDFVDELESKMVKRYETKLGRKTYQDARIISLVLRLGVPYP